MMIVKQNKKDMSVDLLSKQVTKVGEGKAPVSCTVLPLMPSPAYSWLIPQAAPIISPG